MFYITEMYTLKWLILCYAYSQLRVKRKKKLWSPLSVRFISSSSDNLESHCPSPSLIYIVPVQLFTSCFFP